MTLLALDFDGVLCDSAAETAASAWRCAKKIWPALFLSAEAPAEAITAFSRVRPFLETGYQAILMLKMLQEKLDLEVFRTDLPSHLERLMRETGLGPAELKQRFGDCRDQWIQEDLPGWLQTHRFYPGVIAALRQALARECNGRKPISTDQKPITLAILTTKQERFVQQLLAGQNIDFPETQIWGLGRQTQKDLVLRQFLAQGQQEIIFVEDRLPTLELIAGQPALNAIRLGYAPWGYGTEADLARARQNARVQILTLAEFRALLTD